MSKPLPDFNKLDFYKGFNIHVNNKIDNIRLNKKLKFIEINSTFFYRLKPGQQYFLIWQKIYKARGYDLFKADKKAFEKAQAVGYDPVEITMLFKTMKGKKRLLDKRWYFLVTEGDTIEDKIDLFLRKVKAWIRKKLSL